MHRANLRRTPCVNIFWKCHVARTWDGSSTIIKFATSTELNKSFLCHHHAFDIIRRTIAFWCTTSWPPGTRYSKCVGLLSSSTESTWFIRRRISSFPFQCSPCCSSDLLWLAQFLLINYNSESFRWWHSRERSARIHNPCLLPVIGTLIGFAYS